MSGAGHFICLLSLTCLAPRQEEDLRGKALELAEKVSVVRGLHVPALSIRFADAGPFTSAKKEYLLHGKSDANLATLLARQQLAWAWLGLVPPNLDFYQAHFSPTAHRLGFYQEAGAGELWVATSETDEGAARANRELEERSWAAEKPAEIRELWQRRQAVLEEATLASKYGFSPERAELFHLLTHAAQHRRFGIAFVHAADSTDMELAFRALVEGDAALAEASYAAGAGRAAELLAARRTSYERLWQETDLSKGPLFWGLSDRFPNSEGARFAEAARKSSSAGWDGVDQCYRRPPVSTSEVLHPKEYLARTLGLRAVCLSELESVGGGRLEPVWNDSLGELGVRYLLRYSRSPSGLTTLLSPAEADRIAAGWRGDRYQVLRGEGGGVVFGWVSVWSGPEAAREFMGAVTKSFGWRYPRAKALRDEPDRYWVDVDGRVAFVERAAGRVAVGDGIRLSGAEELSGRLWDSSTGPLLEPEIPETPTTFACPIHREWTGAVAGSCRFCGRAMREVR